MRLLAGIRVTPRATGGGLTSRATTHTEASFRFAVALHSDSHKSVIAALAAFGSLLTSSPTAPHHRQNHVHVHGVIRRAAEENTLLGAIDRLATRVLESRPEQSKTIIPAVGMAEKKLSFEPETTGEPGLRSANGGMDGIDNYKKFLVDPKLQGKVQENNPSLPNTGLQNPLELNRKEQAQESMKPSRDLAGYLKTYEDFSDKPYRVSPNDPLTIGYGHVILPGEDFSGGITHEQALEIFQKDLEKHAAVVREWASQNNIKLTQQQFDALVSFVFNNGSIGVEGETQVIADTIKRGGATPDEIRKAFGLYINNKDGVQPGLVSRRRDEANIFLNGDYRRTD